MSTLSNRPHSHCIDYSKWDHIELSDDEDFECHPNVDKPSMIRWKQAAIYRDRRDRKDKITSLEWEKDMNARILSFLNAPEMSKEEQIKKIDVWSKQLESDIFHLRAKERDVRWGAPEPIAFLENRPKVAQLIKDNVPKDEILKQLLERNMAIDAEIAREEAEATKKLTSENMYKEGFSKTIVSKESKEPTKAPIDSGKTKVIETIHTPAPVQEESIKSSVFTDLNVQKFAKMTDLDDGYQFILQHPYIVTQQYSDEVLAYAFELEMDGQTKKCYNTIRQALILQYCALLGKDGIGMFFKKMRSSDAKAKEMFMKDWNDTYNRIKNRVVEIHQETKEKERQEQEYLQKRLELATQPDGTYALPLPENPTEEETDRCQVFARLPQKLQKGLLIQDVDLINEALSELDPKIAGELMEDAGRVGLIDLQEEEDE